MTEKDTSRDKRIKLLQSIQSLRKSKVITYICGDRQGGPQAQIGGDAVRPMYDHLRILDHVENIDIFIYSMGGAIEVPWRRVTMFREHCDRLSILIPYHAHSAATLLALGCDEIVMGKKAELGPIDPSITFSRFEGTEVKENIAIEDVMAFIAFIKDNVPKQRQEALTQGLSKLTDKLTPWNVGKIYRTHSHIRMVAERMLDSHNTSLGKKIQDKAVKILAEEIYSHGHAICRKEAKEIGLPIIDAEPGLDDLMWELFESYEDLLQLRDPIDVNSQFSGDADEANIDVILAAIESEKKTTLYSGDLKLKRYRSTPPNININFNVGVSLPPNIPQDQFPEQLQQAVNHALQNFQRQAPQLVKEQTKQQSPVLKIDSQLRNSAWRNTSG